MKNDKILKLINELRQKRNEINQKIAELDAESFAVQKEIDNNYLELYGVDNWKGRVIKYYISDCNLTCYIGVEEIRRTTKGINVVGSILEIDEDYCRFDSNGSTFIAAESIGQVEIFSNNLEPINSVKKIITNFDKK